MKGPVVHCPATPAAPSAHSPPPKALAPQTRPCHPSPRPRPSRSPEVVPGPAGPSCCPALAQQGPEAPWSAFWARSCLHSQPLSLPLPCPHPHPLPWLIEATAPPLMAPPGALLPGSHPSSLSPHWKPLELRTSVLGETPASPAISIPLLASRTFSGLCPQCFPRPPPPVSALCTPCALPDPPQLATPTHPFDHCSSPAPWHCCPHSPSARSALALTLAPWD